MRITKGMITIMISTCLLFGSTGLWAQPPWADGSDKQRGPGNVNDRKADNIPDKAKRRDDRDEDDYGFLGRDRDDVPDKADRRRGRDEDDDGFFGGIFGDDDDDNDQNRNFSHRDKAIIRDYYARNSDARNLPPGLRKKVARGGSLPPGWQKKLARGEVFPQSYYPYARPLPDDLMGRLPPQPDGVESVIVEGKVVRVIEATGVIVDVLGL